MLDRLEADLREKGDPVTSAGSLGNLGAGKSGGVGGVFINMEVRFPSLSKAKQKVRSCEAPLKPKSVLKFLKAHKSVLHAESKSEFQRRRFCHGRSQPDPRTRSGHWALPAPLSPPASCTGHRTEAECHTKQRHVIATLNEKARRTGYLLPRKSPFVAGDDSVA